VVCRFDNVAGVLLSGVGFVCVGCVGCGPVQMNAVHDWDSFFERSLFFLKEHQINRARYENKPLSRSLFRMCVGLVAQSPR